MVDHVNVKEAARRPTEHAGFDFIDCVRARADPEPTDSLPAGSPVYLNSPTNVKFGVIFEDLATMIVMVKNSTSDSNCRIVMKFSKRLFEIIRLERQIAVQLTHVLPVA